MSARTTGSTFDTAFGIACVLLGLALGYGSYSMEEPAVFQQIGPRHWPAVLAVVLLLVGIAIALRHGRGEAPEVLDDEPAPAAGDAGVWWVFAGILLTIPVLMLFGFWPAGSFLMAVVLYLKETRDHLLRSVIVAVAAPGVVYWLFTSVFDQYLPKGLLFQ
jgi:hypothetical protein